MIQIRKSQERGHARHGWLDSYHTFSFANYHDPQFTGFSDLLVINEDRVQPGQGFGKHGHENMEIVSYVVSGELEHKDSMGNGSVLRPGDVQRLSAGTGVRHSEFNHSRENPVHFLQIWITPEKEGIPPSYEEKRFTSEEKRDRLRLIVSPEGENGSLRIHQKARIFAAELSAGKSVSHSLAPGRHAWVQIVRGEVSLNGQTLSAGDGAAVSGEQKLELVAGQGHEAEFLVFDLN